ncbi:unnamed protein product, partial [Prorocentrum cordatum]
LSSWRPTPRSARGSWNTSSRSSRGGGLSWTIRSAWFCSARRSFPRPTDCTRSACRSLRLRRCPKQRPSRLRMWISRVLSRTEAISRHFSTSTACWMCARSRCPRRSRSSRRTSSRVSPRSGRPTTAS